MSQFAFILLAIAPSAEPAKLPSDAELTKLIGGKIWIEDCELANGDVFKGLCSFRSDGTFRYHVMRRRVVDGQSGYLEMKATGTWKIEGGKMIETVETFDPPDLRKKGESAKGQILAADAKSFTIKTEKGTIAVRRLKE